MSVQSALQMLNIPIEKKVSKNRCMVKCIFHEEKDGSLMVDLTTGIMSCFGCGHSTNIQKTLQNKLGITYKEAEEIVNNNTNHVNTFTIDSFVNNLEKAKPVKKQYEYDVLTTGLKVSESSYLQLRGYTDSYIEEFNIRKCIVDKYMDYMFTPVTSEKLNVDTFEARKIFELEYLQKIMGVKSKSLSRLRARFITNKESYKNSIYYEYLNKSKNYYAVDSNIRNMLYNYDNLNFEKDLIIFEGIPSHAKIYLNITKNCTCTFGSNISDSQYILLKKFNKNIIVVSDNDTASYKTINKLRQRFNNIYVIDTLLEDTDERFVIEVMNNPKLKANDFLIKRNQFQFLQ